MKYPFSRTIETFIMNKKLFIMKQKILEWIKKINLN
jgi:hypothetical protein